MVRTHSSSGATGELNTQIVQWHHCPFLQYLSVSFVVISHVPLCLAQCFCASARPDPFP